MPFLLSSVVSRGTSHETSMAAWWGLREKLTGLRLRWRSLWLMCGCVRGEVVEDGIRGKVVFW